MVTRQEIKKLREKSKQLRIATFDLAREYGGYHFGGALSSADILVTLYNKIIQKNDVFILSKGHACFSWYPLLREFGYNPTISGHPDIDIKNGIWCTTGSLGMGLPTSVGLALSKKIKKESGNVYVLLGEAEFQEGTGWESLLIASHHKLNNLICIIDVNKHQGSGPVKDILSLGNLSKKLTAFGTHVYKVNGHNHENLIYTISRAKRNSLCPSVVLARTIKGKGVSFMEEEQEKWHAKFPFDCLEQVYKDLGGECKDVASKVEFKKSIDLRKDFASTMIELAKKDKNIYILTGDYESGLDEFKKLFPKRCINMGTTEQSTISLAAGMAISGLKPVVYSITPFILERPFEQVKICIDQQNVPVILVGFDDYPEHGPTHASLDYLRTISLFKNIKSFCPRNSLETRQALIDAYESKRPAFIRLRRDYG
jgi:transketolase